MSYNNMPCNHTTRNAAVERCCHARNRAIFAAREAEVDRLLKNPYHHGKPREVVADSATQETIFIAGYRAFMSELPDLDSAASVNDYTACITHGMALDVIDPALGPKLLYSAQIILSAKRNESRSGEAKPAPQSQTAA
jgi:hypothetical protein